MRLGLGQVSAGLFALGMAAIGWGMTHPPSTNTAETPTAPSATSCTVLFIYDGDTLACDLNKNGKADGAPERVRLLGIDAPETLHSRKNTTGKDEPFALEAKAALEKHAPVKSQLWLVFGERPKDVYERPLAFVFAQKPDLTSLPLDPSVNEALLRTGYVRRYVTHESAPLDVAMEARFDDAANAARANNLGLWQKETAAHKPDKLNHENKPGDPEE